MKAIVCKEYGPPSKLVYEDLPSPKPKADEILVSVKACALNFPDTLIIQGLYQFKPDLPFTPGSDIAGVVKEVGENVKHLKAGDQVIGMVLHGAFAEEVIVSKHSCFPMPAQMSYVQAASFTIAYNTSLYALKDRARIKEGETLLVLGASGGVGLTAVEIGKLLGAKVIAAASTDEKLELCKKYGADETINYTKENLKERVKELTNKKGVDVIYDPVGGDYSEQALRAIAWKGRFLVIGFAAGEIPKIPLNLALLKGCQIIGVFYGEMALKYNPPLAQMNMMQLVQWFNSEKVKPHIHATYSLEQAPQALQEILDRKVCGKIVLEVE